MNRASPFDGLCQQCGTSNDPLRKFCYQCAGPLRYVCSSCGWQNSVSQTRCQHCQTDRQRQPVVPATNQPSQSRTAPPATTATLSRADQNTIRQPSPMDIVPSVANQGPQPATADDGPRACLERGSGSRPDIRAINAGPGKQTKALTTSGTHLQERRLGTEPSTRHRWPWPIGGGWAVVSLGLMALGLAVLGLATWGWVAIGRWGRGAVPIAAESLESPPPEPPAAVGETTGIQPPNSSLHPTIGPGSVAGRFSPTGVPDVENSMGMQFVWCPPGQFLMGSPEKEPGHQPDEQQHEVELTAGFYLSRYLVSVQQASLTTGKAPARSLLEHEPRYLERPQVFSTWNEAIVFCRQLTNLPEERSAGRVYRLPTEAEWEYACRAGTTTAFYFGDDHERWPAYAHVGESALARPLGLKVANPWGFYDMAGGIGEWCQDWYEPLPVAPQIDPRGPDQGDRKVIRGQFRSARRQTSSGSNLRAPGTGLRLVVELPPTGPVH